jgi:hypothetical protein
MVTLSEIQAFVNEIAEGYQPEKVYLFGSYANNTANDIVNIGKEAIKTGKLLYERV